MSLPFSLNPFDFLKVLKDKRQMDREQVIGWLQGVKADVRELSEVWLRISDELEKSKEVDVANHKELRRMLASQRVLGSRLQEFYNLATVAVGGRVKGEVWDGFIIRFGRVLYQRNITRADADAFVAELISTRNRISLGSQEDDLSHPKTTEDVALLLQRDLAALDVFIETIKAAPNAFR